MVEKIGLEEVLSKWWGPTTPWNPRPYWWNNTRRKYNSRKKEGRRLLTPWWCQEGSQYWHIHQYSTKTSGSGNVKPPTRRHRKIQDLLSPSSPQAKESGNNRRERGIHRRSTKNTRCTAYPSRRTPQSDWPHQQNNPRNADAEPRSGGTDTSQCSPYQIEHGSNGKIDTDDCDHELHEGATQDPSGNAN